MRSRRPDWSGQNQRLWSLWLMPSHSDSCPLFVIIFPQLICSSCWLTMADKSQDPSEPLKRVVQASAWPNCLTALRSVGRRCGVRLFYILRVCINCSLAKVSLIHPILGDVSEQGLVLDTLEMFCGMDWNFSSLPGCPLNYFNLMQNVAHCN